MAGTKYMQVFEEYPKTKELLSYMIKKAEKYLKELREREAQKCDRVIDLIAHSADSEVDVNALFGEY